MFETSSVSWTYWAFRCAIEALAMVGIRDAVRMENMLVLQGFGRKYLKPADVGDRGAVLLGLRVSSRRKRQRDVILGL
jgi:hypothetical protein